MDAKMEQQNAEIEILDKLCSGQNIPVNRQMLEQLVMYGRLIAEWNQRINLVSRKEDAPILVKHIFHSLLITLYHRFTHDEQVLDLGTGGGLPGIPLAITAPQARFVLVDATGKKITACKEMIKALGLQNAVALHTRVEELRGVRFDTVLSRQVAPLDRLCAWAGSLLEKPGTLICLKGGNLDAEIAKSLDNRKRQHDFPSSVDEHPIDHINPYFSDKKIVIAHR